MMFLLRLQLNFFLQIIAAVSILLINIYYLNDSYRNAIVDRPYRTFDPPPSIDARQPPLILAWTMLFANRGQLVELMRNRSRYCSFVCRYSDDRRMLNESHAIVFHGPDMRIFDIPPITATSIRRRQRYIFYTLESPYYSIDQALFEDVYSHNFFNLTMTYRLDSDISAGNQYNLHLMPRWSNDSVKTLPFVKSIGIADQHDPYYQWQNVVDIVTNKSGMVLQIVSDCHTPSAREMYVRKLANHLTVTIYGQCAKHRINIDQEMELLREYRFYLSFENSVCR